MAYCRKISKVDQIFFYGFPILAFEKQIDNKATYAKDERIHYMKYKPKTYTPVHYNGNMISDQQLSDKKTVKYNRKYCV